MLRDIAPTRVDTVSCIPCHALPLSMHTCVQVSAVFTAICELVIGEISRNTAPFVQADHTTASAPSGAKKKSVTASALVMQQKVGRVGTWDVWIYIKACLYIVFMWERILRSCGCIVHL